MLADLTPIIREGVIDNTKKGLICLKLWCEREPDPISIEMEGNCLRDIAGCRVSFHLNLLPEQEIPHHHTLLELAHSLSQTTPQVIAGDMTLSRRFPLHSGGGVANILSLELFQGSNIRYLIETDAFEYKISLPAWSCSEACETAQEMINMSALHDHVLANVSAFRGPSLMFIGTPEMPACRWDYALNRAEAYMIIYPSIRAKYAGRLRSRLSEAFVLDKLDYLNTAAEEEEHGFLSSYSERNHMWEVLDFMEPEHAKLAKISMRHPLFHSIARLSRIIQNHIISRLEQYPDNKNIEALITNYSGIISHILATIMLAREKYEHVNAIRSRVQSLYMRMQQLIKYGKTLKPNSRVIFQHGANEVLTELRNFLFTLQQ